MKITSKETREERRAFTAREIAHGFCATECGDFEEADVADHGVLCDRITAAVETHDEDLRAALAASQAETAALKETLALVRSNEECNLRLSVERADECDRLAGSLERARLALERLANPEMHGHCEECIAEKSNVSCPWHYKCRITEDRHIDECPAAIARAALAPLTPIATPGTPTEEET